MPPTKRGKQAAVPKDFKTVLWATADKLRDNLTVNWHFKENVRAKQRLMIRNLFKCYKYPPDEQPSATELVLVQAETLFEEQLALV